MPVERKKYFLTLMKKFIEGVVGVWALEAREFINQLEAEFESLGEEEFTSRLSKWDTLLSQAPAWVWKEYTKSGVSFRYGTTA